MIEPEPRASRSLRKVGIITESYDPVVGGAETLLKTLVQGARGLGVDVKVAVPYRAVDGAITGPEVSPAPARRTPLGWLISPRWIRAWSTENACQVLLTSGPSLVEWSAAFAVGRSQPVVSLYHADLNRTKTFSRAANWAHLRLLLPRFDAIVTTSPVLASLLSTRQRRLHPHVILPGIDSPRDVAERTKGKDVLFVGRLPESHSQKRPDLLVEAFSRVRDEVPDVRLHIVGDGPGLPSLKTLAQNLGISGRVEFHGYVRENDKAAIFRASGCLVLPSPNMSEGFGLVNLEALHHGVPIVVSRGAGGSFVVERTGIGRLFEPNDPESLGNAIVTTLAEHRRGRFDSLFDAANQMFSADGMARAYVELWQRVVDARARS